MYFYHFNYIIALNGILKIFFKLFARTMHNSYLQKNHLVLVRKWSSKKFESKRFETVKRQKD